MDKYTLEIVLRVFSTLILVADIVIPSFLILFILNKKQKAPLLSGLFNFLSENFLPFSFLIALSATLGSMFLSGIAKIPPCDLCWYQRIFMFPLPIILGIALFKNDFKVKIYAGVLALIGFLIAIYHIILQNTSLPLPCSNGAVSCASKPFEYFGYITIPVMSATAFAGILLLLLISWKKNK